MKLIFEKSQQGRGCSILPECDVPVASIPQGKERRQPLHLPQMAENDLSRHYTQLMKRTHGVNDGFYPLGSCTMKYNPKVNEEAAALPGFQKIHPLQPESTVQGALEVLCTAEQLLCEITGMDNMTFQPAAGAHGELTGLLLIKAYHAARGDTKRTKIIVPDSAHGTNPASAAMAGFHVVSVPSYEDGCVNVEKLREAVGDDTAGLMLTNPNTVGLFDKNILEITKIIHEAGGLCYYDGANLNAVMGIVRPGDMGFDVVHLNLHKTFSTPHGGGGPGAGPVGCKKILTPFLPSPMAVKAEDGYHLDYDRPQSIGSVKDFYGNFLVVVRALTYILTLGKEGIPEAAQNAVLNCNYLMSQLKDVYDMAFDTGCMHEFVMTLSRMKKEHGVSAMDIAKALLDNGIHPPTMYFPLIVEEALMVEPTETESKETLDEAVAVLHKIYQEAVSNPEALHEAPLTTPVRRLDEVGAARNPRLRYQFAE
ncbi:aminomethyl-transferring glycine dehydrogenase subunit GcvPB [Merdimmobilis hominis]|jgi:glycine dehydrogenase subunit 2|uniref:Probable glycine dehydrogenase (decarboxylating) subunit 2 n=1 Tax=uncultured Anaerotruncus sp. TaxID=905011 RepID=A0A6N2U584_9FIRM|nr:aminomethyl-transferring glycine dehydrogenase subunit GcvPB [Merdimmobilis hominis]MCD4835501.1 aminomethyl-transferring glycine dehydrogenase subunit GcvPB [Merdimmobilis hominis]PWL57500.1 MAG: glycine dehydrogenase subunit 2 [Oscillospiraceae bacterium]